MAEVLITLGIIGIIAALTLPGLIQKHQKNTTVTKLRSTYSLLKQAALMSEVQNGEISSWDLESIMANAENASDTKLTEKIIQTYYEPYLKTLHKANSLAPYEYYYHTPDNKLAGLNGHTHYSIALTNGVYLHFNANYGASTVITARVDINGVQKPNTIGLDIFSIQVYPSVGFKFEGLNRDQLLTYCKHTSPYSSDAAFHQGACGALILYDGWEIKDDYPFKF